MVLLESLDVALGQRNIAIALAPKALFTAVLYDPTNGFARANRAVCSM